MLTLSRKRVAPIGLDVGATGIRAAQVSPMGRRYRVTHAVVYERAIAGFDSAGPDALGAQIDRCLKQGDFSGRHVAAALSQPDVDFHALELPETALTGPTQELDRIVRWEIARLVSDDVEDIETRFWRMPTAVPHSPNAIGVSARRGPILSTVEACRHAGMTCAQMTCGAVALSRVGQALLDPQADGVWGVVDLGARETRLILCVESTPVLVRCVGAGQRDWTQRIADALQVSAETAEIHKCEHGVTAVARGSRRVAGSAPDGEIATLLSAALRPEMTSVAAEIKKSYDYVLCCYPRRQAAGLMLTGGGALIENLAEFFQSLLGITVQRASTLLEHGDTRLCYDVARRYPLELTAVAVGLSLPPETPS